MDKEFSLCVNAVDGERVYSILTPNPGEALAFLKIHDHEGATICLFLPETEKEYNGEEAYNYLEEANGV